MDQGVDWILLNESASRVRFGPLDQCIGMCKLPTKRGYVRVSLAEMGTLLTISSIVMIKDRSRK